MSEPKAPILRRTLRGWLAVSPPDASLKFAVTGTTEDDARRRYLVAYREWREIQRRPSPSPSEEQH